MFTLVHIHTLILFIKPPDIPTMVGRPSSRATTAECDSKLPLSIARPEQRGYRGTQPGSVRAVMRISPFKFYIQRGQVVKWERE